MARKQRKRGSATATITKPLRNTRTQALAVLKKQLGSLKRDAAKIADNNQRETLLLAVTRWERIAGETPELVRELGWGILNLQWALAMLLYGKDSDEQRQAAEALEDRFQQRSEVQPRRNATPGQRQSRDRRR